MFNDYSRNEPDRAGTDYRASTDYPDRDVGASGPGIYYALATLLVICAVAAAFIFSGSSSHEQLAKVPDRGLETTLPAPANPATPGLPSAAPGKAPPRTAPNPAPQE